MINAYRYCWTKYCCEPLEQIENFKAAEAESFVNWVVHHRAEILPCGKFSVNDLMKFGLYLNRPASELIWLRHEEHIAMHKTGHKFLLGKHKSAETRKKMSISLKGRVFSKEHREKLSTNNARAMLGRHHSEQSRQKMSNAQKGKNTWTKGSHWWNNGVSNKKARECPSPEWKPGRL